MREETITIMKLAVENDNLATDEEKKRIIKELSQINKEETTDLISAKEVCEILNITRRTLANYVSDGKLRQINYSSRKICFVKSEVMSFSSIGINETKENKGQTTWE